MRTFIGACLLILVAMPAWGQEKVGTEYQTLPISPSVRSDGMGGAGMTLLDNESIDINPGVLGLLHADNRFNLSFSPVGAGSFWYDQTAFKYLAFSVGLLRGNFRSNKTYRLNIAYHVTRYKWETSVNAYPGTDSLRETNALNISCVHSI